MAPLESLPISAGYRRSRIAGSWKERPGGLDLIPGHPADPLGHHKEDALVLLVLHGSDLQQNVIAGAGHLALDVHCTLYNWLHSVWSIGWGVECGEECWKPDVAWIVGCRM